MRRQLGREIPLGPTLDFQLGDRVTYTAILRRQYVSLSQGYHDDSNAKVWERHELRAPVPGVIVGRRRLSNGKNRYHGYDEPIQYVHGLGFWAYLVAPSLHLAHVQVYPQDLHLQEEK